MNKAPAFQFYPKDFITDENVVMMSLAQKGVYIVLMSHQWLHGSIPDDLAALARICQTSEREMRKLWPGVAACFPPTEDGRLANRRMSKDNEDLKRYREQASEAGKEGARSRWGKKRNRVPHADPMPDPMPTPMRSDGSPFSVLHTAPSGTDNGLPAAPAPAKAPDWNREAADDFREAYRADPPKLFFAQVKAVAQKYGWTRTRPALKAYMGETPIEFLNVAKCLAVKVEGGGAPIRGKPPVADRNDAVVTSWAQEVREGKR